MSIIKAADSNFARKKWWALIFHDNYLRADAADGRPVVGDLFPGLDELIVDAVAEVIYERDPGENGVLTFVPDTNHLAINAYHLCEPEKNSY